MGRGEWERGDWCKRSSRSMRLRGVEQSPILPSSKSTPVMKENQATEKQQL
jgi:hypothetical protein